MIQSFLNMSRRGSDKHTFTSCTVRRRLAPNRAILAVVASLAILLSAANAQTPSITYQGELEKVGMPTDGAFDFQFIFFADPDNNDDITAPIALDDIQVNDGLFTAEIPVSPAIFAGQDVWLEVRVREGSSTGGYTILAPRQKIDGAPLALHALTVAEGSVDSNQLANHAVGSSKIANGAVGAPQIQNGSIDGEELVANFSFERNSFSTPFKISNNRTTEGVALEVINQATSTTSPALLAGAWRGGPAMWGQSYGLSDTDRVLVLQNNTWSGTPGGSYTPNTIFEVEGNGDVNIDGSFNSGGADFAEAIAATEGTSRAPEPGDVMIIDTESSRTVTMANAPRSTLVAGVYSNDPGVVGRTDEHHLELADHIPLGIVGIVPSNVSAENGPVEAGDLLVTSGTPGHAMRASDPSPGTILGKALESLDGGRGQILVLLSLQ